MRSCGRTSSSGIVRSSVDVVRSVQRLSDKPPLACGGLSHGIWINGLVPTGGNLDGALGAFLAFDVLQIEPRHRRSGKLPMRGTNRYRVPSLTHRFLDP